MANEQYAFIEKAKVPTQEAWQTAINECGFDFQLDEELMPFKDSGFLPCNLMGKPAGFEIYYDNDPDFLSDYSKIAQGRNYCISFRWGGSMIECASVLIASYALAKKFDAIISYEGDVPMEDKAFLEEIELCLQDAEKEFK